MSFVQLSGYIHTYIRKCYPARFTGKDWFRVVDIDVAELFYTEPVNILMTCYKAFVETVKPNTHSKRFVQHTRNLDGILRNICIIFTAVIDTGVVIVTSSIRPEVRMLHKLGICIDIFAWVYEHYALG